MCECECLPPYSKETERGGGEASFPPIAMKTAAVYLIATLYYSNLPLNLFLKYGHRGGGLFF